MINRLIKLLRFPLRLLVLPPILISFLSEYVSSTGLFFSILSAMIASVFGEGLAKSRLRQSGILALTILCLLIGGTIAAALSQLTFFSTLLGPSHALALRSVLLTSISTFGVIFGLRALAVRSNVWFSIELMVLIFLCAFAFAPHRDGLILQPLWLSDWAWRNGLEPTVILGVLGSVLVTLLAVLAVLDRAKKIPPSIIFLPVLALLALISLDPQSLWFDIPPPSGVDSLRDELEGERPKGARGGESDEDSEMNEGAQGEGESENGQESERAFDGDGEGGSSGKSNPVAVVLFQNDYEPFQEYYYFRQDAHSYYSGLRMNRSSKTEVPDGNLRSFPTTETQAPNTPPSIHRLPVDTEVYLLTPHNLPFGLETPVQYKPIPNPRPARFNRVYSTSSLSVDIDYGMMLEMEVGSSDWPPFIWEHYTSAPEDPRYKALADEIISELPFEYQELDFAKAVAIKLYLDENMKYTQKVKHDGVPDPTADFLFGETNRLIGYCVHSASALAYLLRTQGIPSRIGIGYATSAESRSGSAVMVMDSDAHTWPEIYIENVGWVVLDVSPAENLDATGDPINKEMLDALAELARSDADSEFRDPIDWAALWASAKPIAIGGLTFAFFAILCGLYIVKFNRLFRPNWVNGPQLSRVVLISALDRLSSVGVQRNIGESRESFAQRVLREYPQIVPITYSQLGIAFGQTGKADTTLKASLSNLQEAISSNVVWWRQLLGWLNPFSFYRTR